MDSKQVIVKTFQDAENIIITLGPEYFNGLTVDEREVTTEKGVGYRIVWLSIFSFPEEEKIAIRPILGGYLTEKQLEVLSREAWELYLKVRLLSY